MASVPGGTERSELSRILAGKLMPSKEWLTRLHEARESEGSLVPSQEREDAFTSCMHALKEAEEATATRAGKQRPYPQRRARYDLERKLEAARRKEHEAGTELAEARHSYERLEQEAAELRLMVAG